MVYFKVHHKRVRTVLQYTVLQNIVSVQCSGAIY